MGIGRKIVGGLIIGAIALVPVLGVTSTAFAADGENTIAKKIVDELGSRNTVAVIQPAELSNKDLIEDKVFEGGTSIVAVKRDSLGDYKPTDLSRFIVDEDGYGYDTSLNLLVVDNGRESKIYVSSPNDELETAVVSLLGEATTDGGIVTNDPGWTILRNADAIKQAQVPFNGSPSGETIGIIFAWIGAGVVALILLIWLICAIVGQRRRTRYQRHDRKVAKTAARAAAAQAKVDAKKAKEAAKLKRKTDAQEKRLAKEREATAAKVTDPIENQINDLRTVEQNVRLSDERLADGLKLVLERFVELRESLTLMDTPEVRRNILFVEYEDRLEKLTTIVGPKYYDDLKRNPEHWREPEKKLDAIRESIEATAEQILENIRQLKEGSEFDFELVIDSILGFKVIDPKDMLK